MALAIILLIIGTSFPLLLNGQVFTNSLMGIALLSMSAAICVMLNRKDDIGPVKRIVIRIVAGLDVFLIVILIVLLPGHYQFQSQFNRHIQEFRQNDNQPK